MFNNKIYFNVKNILDGKFTRRYTYRNGVIASAFALGRENELTENKVRNGLLGDVEDGFLTYDEALALFPKYMEAIQELRA